MYVMYIKKTYKLGLFCLGFRLAILSVTKAHQFRSQRKILWSQLDVHSRLAPVCLLTKEQDFLSLSCYCRAQGSGINPHRRDIRPIWPQPLSWLARGLPR